MQFLRDNLLYVCVIAVVVVAAAGLLPMASSWGFAGDVDKALEQRKELDRDMDRVGTPAVNAKILANEHKRVAMVRQAQNEVLAMSTRWNGRHYRPFVLTFNTAKGPRQIPAFPIDRRLYQQYGLSFKVTDIYRTKLEDLRPPLRPVPKFTDAERQKRTLHWERVLGEREDMRDKTARELADEELLIQKAGKGLVYFEPEALDVVRLPETSQATPVQMYHAMLNYWVTSDILAAVKAANDEAAAAARARGIKEPGVTEAAVKEILKIDIDEDYSRAQRRSFTGHETCKDYSVISYRLTVVMPLSSLAGFQRQLLERNYHTIVNVQADEAERKKDRYYGTAPVMRVTLTCELILLAGWERGTATSSVLAGPADILRWGPFAATLARQGRAQAPSPGKRIWSDLSKDLQSRLSRLALTGNAPNQQTQAQVVRELNRLLAMRDFYSPKNWEGVELTVMQHAAYDRLQEDRLAGQELAHFNRAMLHAAFPGHIAEPAYRPALVPVQVLEKMRKDDRRPQDNRRMTEDS